MGILANDGVRRPTLRIRSLRFAAGTPFDTIVKPRLAADERLLPSSLVAVVKQELIGVVKEGTARRISGVMAFPDGTPVEVGGKTGTGDNRFTRFAKGGGMIESRVINRTGTFVFMIKSLLRDHHRLRSRRRRPRTLHQCASGAGFAAPCADPDASHHWLPPYGATNAPRSAKRRGISLIQFEYTNFCPRGIAGRLS
jgi:hypothetical protein